MMRCAILVGAGLWLFAAPAIGDDDKTEWKDSRGREWKREVKSGSGESTEGWKDGRGREWKREVKPGTGEWKEIWKDGRCTVERSVDGNGRYQEKTDC